MEVGQHFVFPFPTLKQLSLVSIGQLFVNKAGRSAGFPNILLQSPRERRAQYLKYDGIVETLPVPDNSKRLILTTSAGMYEQLCDWHYRGFDYFWMFNKDMEVIFNVNGIVDESQTWQKCFERVTGKNNVDKGYLRVLLEIACCRTLVPLISIVLRKILILEGLASTPLEEHGQEIVDGQLVLVYSFGNTQVPDTTSPAYETFRWLSTCRWKDVSINVTDDGIRMHLDPQKSMNSVKEHFSHLLGSSETLHLSNTHLSGYILLGLSRLADADLRIFLERVKTTFRFEKVFLGFLKWPFTQFLVPVVKFLREHLETDTYIFIFLFVLHLISDNQGPDIFGYGDLLLEFCNICPPDVKQQLRSQINQ